jgi:hypothetical protein
MASLEIERTIALSSRGISRLERAARERVFRLLPFEAMRMILWRIH